MLGPSPTRVQQAVVHTWQQRSTWRAAPSARPRHSRPPAATAAAAGGAGAAPAAQGAGQQQQAGSAVYRLYDAINARDVSALAGCFAAGVQYQNLALLEAFNGTDAVVRFYQDSLAALPPGAVLQLEQQAGQPLQQGQQAADSGGYTTAVLWRLVLPSSSSGGGGGSSSASPLTLSRGIALFTLDVQGRISSITDSPEHPVKLSAAGLTVFGPLLAQGAGGVLPAVQELGRAVQQGVGLLLQPLEGVMATQTAGGSAAATAGNWAATSSSSSSSSSSTATSWSSTSSTSSSSSSSSWPGASVGVSSPMAAAAPPRQAVSVAGAGIARGPVTTTAAAGGSRLDAAAAAAGGQQVVAAAAAAGGGPAGGVPDQPDLSGLWVKVPERCDTAGFEAALDVLGLSGLQKVTARLIDGLELQQTPSRLRLSFVTVVPFFRVSEEVPLDGSSSQQGRRDLRWGQQSAQGRLVPGGVLVEMGWGAPMAGSLSERYTLLPDGCLCVEAHTRVGDRAAHSTTIYRRASGSREQLLSDSKARNPSVAAVLQQQRQQGLDV